MHVQTYKHMNIYVYTVHYCVYEYVYVPESVYACACICVHACMHEFVYTVHMVRMRAPVHVVVYSMCACKSLQTHLYISSVFVCV